ncbi:uncharacterized protein LOC132058309 [Lycium ferocissimum]|uniref:uncharacterized protein LOC132058309 n=1 Tax=Lycium ferocissimum TaxID=112874 RepID=UPI00281575F3|nr:uncharacterized protein LOC132058309 [Lycium ferocissimum]
MGDNSGDLGAVVRNCNINRLNNVVVPSLGIKSQTFENDVDWNFFDNLLDDDRDGIPFKGLAEFISRDLPTAHEQKPDDQSSSIINPTTPNPIQPAQFSKPIIRLPPPSPPLALRVPVATIPCVPAATPYQLINPQQQVVMHAKVHPTFTVPSRNALIQTRRR